MVPGERREKTEQGGEQQQEHTLARGVDTAFETSLVSPWTEVSKDGSPLFFHANVLYVHCPADLAQFTQLINLFVVEVEVEVFE